MGKKAGKHKKAVAAAAAARKEAGRPDVVPSEVTGAEATVGLATSGPNGELPDDSSGDGRSRPGAPSDVSGPPQETGQAPAGAPDPVPLGSATGEGPVAGPNAGPIDPNAAPLDPSQLATRLNSVAIHLLRRLAREDAQLGLSGAQLSALSVLVFGGARPLGRLADAEGVSPPSMTRLASVMQSGGLVERVPSTTDGRSVVIRATAHGEAILLRGREQRVVALASWLGALRATDLATLDRAADLLESVLRDQRTERTL